MVGLTEFRSSQVCMWCNQYIEHVEQKHHRVYRCSNCERHSHRDDSSSDLHCSSGWSEVIGVKEAMERNEIPDVDAIVRYRPRIFMTKWMLKVRQEQQQQQLQQMDQQQQQDNQQQELNEPLDGNELDPLVKGSAVQSDVQRTTEG